MGSVLHDENLIKQMSPMLAELQLVRLLFSVASLLLLFSAHFPRSQRVFCIVVTRTDPKAFAIHTSYHWHPSSKWMVSWGFLVVQDCCGRPFFSRWWFRRGSCNMPVYWLFRWKNSTLAPTFFLSAWQEEPNRRSYQLANFCFLSQTRERCPTPKHISTSFGRFRCLKPPLVCCTAADMWLHKNVHWFPVGRISRTSWLRMFLGFAKGLAS